MLFGLIESKVEKMERLLKLEIHNDFFRIKQGKKGIPSLGLEYRDDRLKDLDMLFNDVRDGLYCAECGNFDGVEVTRVGKLKRDSKLKITIYKCNTCGYIDERKEVIK